MDDRLRERLTDAGIDPDAIADPAAAWRRLHEREGPRATVIDRYQIEAAVTGQPPGTFDADTRLRLAVEVLSVRDPGFTLLPGTNRVMADPIEVVPYDPAWPGRFEAWRARLAGALGPAARRIDHVGSTAVPGLPAKPVIDVQVSVTDVEAEAGYVPPIESLGLALRARETGHRYFRPVEGAREVQLHVCGAGSAWERDHLLLRDFLRADRAAAARYAAAKLEAAEAYRNDRIGYNEAKSGAILDLLEAAEAWAARTGWPSVPPGGT